MESLSRDQVAQFEDQGYLVVKGLFDPRADLDPVIEEYFGVLDGLTNSLFEKGEISSRYESLGFSQKLIKIQQETGQIFTQNFDFSLPQSGIKADTPIWLGEAVFNILRNERLLDAIESLIGSEIYSNPVQHVRLKMPEAEIPQQIGGNVRTTPWHQDSGVVTPDADETNMVTVWFPLWDAPVSAGPLRIMPYAHRAGLMQHCPTPAGMQIPRQFLDEDKMLAVPLMRGDALFMHRLTPHSSLPNKSGNIRWSFDLRYHPIGQATGRDAFPGFVARSRKAPEIELRNAQLWADQWRAARVRLAAQGLQTPFNRWDKQSPLCA